MKPGPNAPCPCGSGRKYKKCHGAPGAAPARVATQPASAQAWLARGREFEAAGRPEEAETCYQRALLVEPNAADAWLAIATLAERAGDFDAARECYVRLLAAHPGDARAHFMLGNIHARSYDLTAARDAYRRAVELDPDIPGAWNNLGNVEKYFGNFSVALDCYRRAIEQDDDPQAQARRHSHLLLSLHYDQSLSHDGIYRAHSEWAERHAKPWYPQHAPPKDLADPHRVLRVGYLAGGSGGGILDHFLQDVLAHHDRSQVRVHVYSSGRKQDAVTKRFRDSAERWIDASRLDDEELAQRIRTDAIDILVDLHGHGPDGRPLVLARKPAPIQIEWLDYFNTTGMPTVDYLITDPYTTPANSPQRFAEMPIRLRHTRFCYRPVDYAPAVAPVPSRAQQPFTFGSFNRLDKLHPALLAVWAQILRGVPDSRLLLKSRALQAPAVRRALLDNFAALDVAPDRLVLRGPSPHAEMLGEYAQIDIALDTFPYNGGLTTCECLWMGVPIVALEEERMIGRQTSALLRLLGLDDWVAVTRDEYVRLAIEKSGRRGELDGIRAEIRPRMARSPLCDASAFARELEGVYRKVHIDGRSA